MALADFLGMLQPQQPQPTNDLGFAAARPGYGAQFNLPSAPVPQAQAQGGYGHGLGGILDRIGDALLISHGMAPMHYQRAQQQQLSSALSSFLGADQTLAPIIAANPEVGAALYKIRHPEDPELIREMLAAGIDPTSDEGKAILRDKLTGGNDTGSIKDYRYYQSTGGKLSFGDFLRILHPPGGGTFEEDGGGEAAPAALPHVTDQKSYDAIPPGAQYTTPDGKTRVKPGGQTVAPSGNFP
jgi:hypothetical protein